MKNIYLAIMNKGFTPTELVYKDMVVLQSLHSYGVFAKIKQKPQRGNTFVNNYMMKNISTIGATQNYFKNHLCAKKNKDIARKGGNAAKQARLEIEKQTGKSIISSANANKLMDTEKLKIENEGDNGK